MIAALCFVAAAVVAFWPRQARPLPTFSVPPAVAPSVVAPLPKRPGFRQAIDNLAYVRSRLITTDALDDKAKAAIDTLTLALVAGSDQE